MDSSSSPSSALLYFQAIYPFQGNRDARQLTFARGAVLCVQAKHAAAAANGWTWGSLVERDSARVTLKVVSEGWFPTGYVVLFTDPAASWPSSSSSSRPTLPWIKQEQQQRDEFNEQEDNGFAGNVLGGQSPALDYSVANTDLHGQNSNPFLWHESTDLHRDDDRVTIIASDNHDKKLQFGKRLQQGWQKAGAVSTKLLSSRRRQAENSMVPSVSVTPSTQ